MNTKNKFKYIIFTLMLLFTFFSSGCSYLVDTIEGGITNRSSFSITGAYADGMVTISWEGTLIAETNQAFAGYEIYVTEQPDNEFIGYRTIIAPYNLDQDLYRDEMRQVTRNSVSFDPDICGLSGSYFFRLGVIYWDKTTKKQRDGTDDDDEDEENETTGWMPDQGAGETYGLYFEEYDPASDEYDPDDDNQLFYENKTHLDRVSGSIMIDI